MNEMTTYMLSLLIRWEKASRERRNIERACAYPEVYGGDEEVLKETQDLLSAIQDISENK